MVAELNLAPNPDSQSPLKNGLATFIAFTVAGFLPLTPYVFSTIFNYSLDAIRYSLFMAGLALFLVGSLRTLITRRHWLRSGLEMLIIGAVAATVAYATGFLLHKLV